MYKILFNGTVNFSVAKIKIFQDGLGLDANLLSSVKINFNKCPNVTFRLKSKINVRLSIKSSCFEFTRNYHSKGILKTDTIECKVAGLLPLAPNRKNETNNGNKKE